MPRHELEARLQELFPPDHPASSWLLRLMIIRDDLQFEFQGLGLREQDGPEQLWRCVYFLRRIAVSISEARAILEQEVGKAAAHPQDEAMKLLAPSFRRVTEIVRQVAETIAPIRNALGAHLRPQYAEPGATDVTGRVLKNHPNLSGTVVFEELHGTSYRELTSNALVLAWPDADSDAAVENRHVELSQAVLGVVPKLIHAIDALLAHHWMILGLLKPPDDYDFAVRDARTGEMVRLVLKHPDGAA